MNFKTKSDISFIKFLAFSEETEGMKEDVDFVSDKIIDVFYNGHYKNKEKKVNQFLKAIQTPGKLKMRYKLNLEVLNNTGKFIDSQVFSSDKDFDSLLFLLLKKKYFWQQLKIDKISITEGEFILNSFLKGQRK